VLLHLLERERARGSRGGCVSHLEYYCFKADITGLVRFARRTPVCRGGRVGRACCCCVCCVLPRCCR
jgi:hypothetical protein